MQFNKLVAKNKYGCRLYHCYIKVCYNVNVKYWVKIVQKIKTGFFNDKSNMGIQNTYKTKSFGPKF